jgi:hypothetical protein
MCYNTVSLFFPSVLIMQAFWDSLDYRAMISSHAQELYVSAKIAHALRPEISPR